ncbi:MAG: hypothetical protein IZT58_13655, partial [Actinobacteria bacterium]|nr:hypothetical protein [Actinomycetota bacterium]
FVSSLGESFGPAAFTYNLVFVLMIFLFAYFWTTVQFQPKEMAKRLRDAGSFIPGLRPGHRTAEYLERVRRNLFRIHRRLSVGAPFDAPRTRSDTDRAEAI